MFEAPRLQDNYRFLGTNTTPLIILLHLISSFYDLNTTTLNVIAVIARLIYIVAIPVFASFLFGVMIAEMTKTNHLFFWSQVIFLFLPTVFFRSLTFYPDSFLPSMIVLVLYFAWRVTTSSKSQTYVYLGVSLALMLSTKPTSLFYLPFVAFAVAKSKGTDTLRTRRAEYLSLILSASTMLFVLNLGAFLNPRTLFRGMRFNYQNYTILDFDFTTGSLFYLFSLFPLSLSCIFFLYVIGIAFLIGSSIRESHVNYLIPAIWAICIPVFYLIFWGQADRLLVRNALVAFPAIAIGISFGIRALLTNSKGYGKLLLVLSLTQGVLSFSTNWQITRNSTEKEVVKFLDSYVPDDETIIINTSCNGKSPAEFTNPTKVFDSDEKLDARYYLVDSRSKHQLAQMIPPGIFFETNLVSSHFSQFDNAHLFRPRGHTTISAPGYRLVATFLTPNATFFLLEQAS